MTGHRALFETAIAWREAGRGMAIATVAATWGSSPRPKGSHLLIRDDGLFEGSVSGGCVEGDVIANGLECLANSGHKLLDYGITNPQAWEVGLACGGRLTVLVQAVGPGGFGSGLFDLVLTGNGRGETVRLETDLATGRTRAVAPDETAQEDGRLLELRYDPPLRLAIIGAVHITQALAPMAAQLGYEVLVIDPRRIFSAPERMEGVSVSEQWPDEALEAWAPGKSSAVVTLTHDPKLDDAALKVALHSPAFYIASLGSRKTHAARLERLREAGFSPQNLARINGPAGLDIQAETPAEIAVSILAQMTAALRGK